MTIKDNIKWIWSLSKGVRMRLSLNIILGLISVGCSLLFVWLSKLLIDLAIDGELEGNFIFYSLFLIGTLIFQHASTLYRSRVDSCTNVMLMNNIRERLFYHVMLSEWSGKEKFHTGDITARLDGDVRKICDTLSTTFPALVITAVQFIASFAFMLMLDARLAWVLLIIMPTTLLMSKRYMLKLRELTHSIRTIDSNVQAHIQEKVQNRTLINSMGHTDGVQSQLKVLGQSLFTTTLNRTNYTLFSRGMVQVGFSAGYVTAFLWGVNGLSNGTITFGVMTAFLQLVSRIQLPVVDLSSQVSNIAQTTTSADRLAELDSISMEEQGESQLLNGGVGVSFNKVVFNYSEGKESVISNFNYNFTPNKLHIILGKTGIGKSTLLRLILGFLKPNLGDIKIYNSLESYSCSPLTRANFIYVPQGNTLISGTVRENLLLGNPNASDKEIEAAINTAVAEFVYNLPNGIDTLCGERGAGLSEGEAQRVAIARGLLNSGSIMLLDEPTSALDSSTETLLIERLLEYAKNRTIIMVTHRESVANGKNDAQILKL